MSITKKRLCAFLLCAVLIVPLTGCGKIFDAVSPAEEVPYFPVPKPENAVLGFPAEIKDNIDLYTPNIYYADPAGDDMLSRTRIVSLNAQEDINRRLVEEILNASAVGVLPVAPKNSRVLFTESCPEFVTVCIQPSSALTENERLLLSGAVSRTILENNGKSIRGVSILLGDRAMRLGTLPIGVITQDTDLAAMMNESAPVPEGAYTRNVLLYLPAADEKHIVRSARSLSVSYDDPAFSVIAALSQTDFSKDAVALRLNPDNAFEKKSEYTVLANGDRILNLYFTESALTSLSSAPHTLNQAFAAITLTLMDFLPATDGVSIHFPSGQVTEIIRAPGDKVRCENGVLTRSHFSALIGTPVKVYFSNASGRLSAETRICPVSDARSISARIRYLLDGPQSESLENPVPDGISMSDFMRISISDGIARVDLSGEIYRRCQALDENGEMLFVYALVNTLCELDSVNAVRFYVEGKTVSSLAQYIHLESALLKNPGLISER